MENGKLNFVSTKLVRDKTIGEGKIIGSKDEAISFMAEHLEDCDREYFVVLNLDAKLKVLNANIASIGGLDGVVIHPREIFKTSILSNARSVILFHNHPSGDPKPSKEDVDVTNRLIKAGKLLGIEVNDHIVIGDGKHISLRETEAANFYNIDEPNISELDEWDILYERDKILKQEDIFSVERNIDGMPYKFNLSVDEISKLYEKLEQKQDLEFKENEGEKKMDYILVKQKGDDSFDEEFEIKEDALKALDAEWYHLSKNDQKNYTSVYVLKSVQPNEEEEFHYDGDIIKAYKYDGHDYTDLENCPEFMRNDKDVVLDAVRYRADSIQFASEELRNDKDVVLEAVNRDGLVLEILSKEFQNDKDVILEAIKNDIEALEFASKEIKADKEFLLKAIKYGSDALLFASEEIKADKEFMFKAVKYNRWTLEFASDEIKNDKEFLLKAIEVNPDCKELAESYLRKNTPQKLQKGDIIETALGKKTTVLDVENDTAVLFSGKQFVIASGIKSSEVNGLFEWSSGQYADDLEDIANIKNKDFATMKETINTLSDMYHRDFVKSVVSLETGLNDDTLLDDLYDTYMRSDDMRLISDEIYDLAKDMKELSNLNERCDMKIEI